MAKKKFYAVAIGRKPGIYETWEECEKQTKGFSGAKFKSFPTRDAAQSFITQHSSTAAVASITSNTCSENSNEATTQKEERPRKRQRTAKDPSPASTITSAIINVHFDGGSRGNPGRAGAGALVEISSHHESEGNSSVARRQTLHVRKYLGRATNNIAEYQGLICGLQEAMKVVANFKSSNKNDCIHLTVKGDSDLVIQQLNGAYQCKSKNLVPLYREAQSLVSEMKQLAPMKISFEHVYREDNSVADALANEAMDTGRSWTTTEDGETETGGERKADERKVEAETTHEDGLIYV